jgi:ribulose-5-phosphate 4-epimerase/fuculose-1-phosphate aldolase
MQFKINKISESPDLLNLCTNLTGEILRKGHELIDSDQKANFVLNLIDLDNPVSYRRKGQEEMVVSIVLITETDPDLKSACYSALIKSISNILFCILMPGNNQPAKGYSITPEVGFTEFDYTAENMFKYMYPVISAHFVLRNKIFTDLLVPENAIIPEVENLIVFARELKRLGVLPAPFPLAKFLDQEHINHLFRLYQIKGLSYGNLSIRNDHYKMEGTTFWMTARGVDKSQLKGVGKDIILVKGYNKRSGEMLISVPPDYDPRVRVSVDAIEHYMIYREFPVVGAIVHVHAWIDNVVCTTQAFPCGTQELAENVVAMLKSTSSPERTEVGLKNHGLTITGPDIREIFERISGRLNVTVPMFN